MYLSPYPLAMLYSLSLPCFHPTSVCHSCQKLKLPTAPSSAPLLPCRTSTVYSHSKSTTNAPFLPILQRREQSPCGTSLTMSGRGVGPLLVAGHGLLGYGVWLPLFWRSWRFGCILNHQKTEVVSNFLGGNSTGVKLNIELELI